MSPTAYPDNDGTPNESNRSFAIEAIGLFSAVAFFFGVYFAYRTFSAGVVTQGEFQGLQAGLSLADANSRLDMEGRRLDPKGTGSTAEIYRWENSTLSYVECEFVDGQLVSKKAVELPH